MKRIFKSIGPSVLLSLLIHGVVIGLIGGIGILTSGDDLPLAGGGGGGTVTVEIVGDGGNGGKENRVEDKAVEPRVDIKTKLEKDAMTKVAPKSKARVENPSKKSGSPSLALAGPGVGPGAPGTGAGPSGGTNTILAEIRSRIERAKQYPLLLRKAGVQGVATVGFRINTQGRPEDIVLKTSSGSPALDDEALATIKRAAPYPVYEDGLAIGIHFELRNEHSN